MKDVAMEIALNACTIPECRKCGVSAVPEIVRETAYTNNFRIACPECGDASDWYPYDSYCHSIPDLWKVIRMAFADFKRRE